MRFKKSTDKPKLTLVPSATEPEGRKIIKGKPGRRGAVYRGETELILNAFEYYYSLFDNRSYKKVSEKFKVHIMTVATWARKFKWKSKVLARNIDVEEKLREETCHSVIKVKKRYSIMFQQVVEDFFKYEKTMREKAIAEGKEHKGPIQDITDLEKVVKLHLLMLGDATERRETINKDRKELEKMLDSNPEAKEHVEALWRMTELKAVGNEDDD